MNPRKTFVIWISREPLAGSEQSVLEGRIEEVDSGLQRKFQSAEQLISFLEQSLSAVESNSTGS